MSCKVYVGGLPWACNADELKQVCSKYGAVEDAFIVMDKTAEIPRSKGFGFVTFQDASQAAECQRSLNGSEYGGRILKVGAAHKETEGGQRNRGYGAGGSRFSGGGYGGSGGYGQGYGGYGSGSSGYDTSAGGGYGSGYSGSGYTGSYGASGGYAQDMSYGGASGGYSSNGNSNQYVSGGYGNYGNGYSYDSSGY